MTGDGRRRVELLATAIRAGAVHTIDTSRVPVVVRVELAPGERQISMLGAEDHALLVALLAEGPRTVTTRSAGVLTYEPLRESWCGVVGDVEIAIHGSTLTTEAAELAADAAVAALGRLDAIRAAIAERLWKLYDTEWRPDEGGVADVEAFRALPTLRFVSVDAARPSRVSVELDDHDLFAGHAIMVGLDGDAVVDVSF